MQQFPMTHLLPNLKNAYVIDVYSRCAGLRKVFYDASISHLETNRFYCSFNSLSNRFQHDRYFILIRLSASNRKTTSFHFEINEKLKFFALKPKTMVHGPFCLSSQRNLIKLIAACSDMSAYLFMSIAALFINKIRFGLKLIAISFHVTKSQETFHESLIGSISLTSSALRILDNEFK